MTRKMIIMLAVVGVILGGIFGYHAFMGQMMKQYLATMGPPPVAVSTVKVAFEPWQDQIKAVGTLRSFNGVDIATEVPGVVKEILFKSSDEVKQGDLLLKLNDDAEQAQLQSLQADADLAKTTLERDKKQFEAKVVAQAVVDNDQASLDSKTAMVLQQQAMIDKKNIKAPFNGKLGICTLNVGGYLNAGDKIVTIQDLDHMYVDFYLPQQDVSKLSLGQKITLKSDAFVNEVFEGSISAINPKIESDSRNVQIQAEVANPKHELLPGMFVSVLVQSGESKNLLTLPQSAVSFNPYGETVYVVEEKEKDKEGKPKFTVRQTFITTGETRGDQVAVLTGIKQGEEIVTLGGHKLRNGSVVIINNEVQPLNDPAPKVKDQ